MRRAKERRDCQPICGPVLFSLLLNDLKGFLTSNNVQGLKVPFALAQDVCLPDIDFFCICFYCCTRMTQLY